LKQSPHSAKQFDGPSLGQDILPLSFLFIFLFIFFIFIFIFSPFPSLPFLLFLFFLFNGVMNRFGRTGRATFRRFSHNLLLLYLEELPLPVAHSSLRVIRLCLANHRLTRLSHCEAAKSGVRQSSMSFLFGGSRRKG